MTLRLTPREREIAERIQAGKSYKAIAAELGLEETTVGAYAYRIAQRLAGGGTPLRKILRAAPPQPACEH